MPRKTKTDREFLCIGCGVHTGELNEYYIVHDAVWLTANPKHAGMLCIGCVEKRIGRELCSDDFTWLPINLRALFFGSERLRDRMNAADMLVFGLGDLELSVIAWGIVEAEMKNQERVEAAMERAALKTQQVN